jgi:hypothetical protein
VSKSVRLILGLPFVVFHLCASADIFAPAFQDLIGIFPMSHSVEETLQVNIAIDPPQNLDESALVTYRLVLVGGDPYSFNAVEDTVSIRGFGTFSVRHHSDQPDGQASIDVNGQELCCVKVINNRMTYMVRLQSGEEATFLSGGEIPILGSTRATVATRVFSSDTGATRSSDVIPVGILDSTTFKDIGPYSQSILEATDLLVAVGDIPGVDNRSNVRVTHGFELHTGDGILLGEFGARSFAWRSVTDRQRSGILLCPRGQQSDCVPRQRQSVKRGSQSADRGGGPHSGEC